MSDFSINDRRGAGNSRPVDHELRSRLSAEGVSIRRAKEQAQGNTGLFGNPGTRDSAVLNHLREQRPQAGLRRRQAALGGDMGSFQIATGRPRDPFWYWKQNNIPYDFTDPAELIKIRQFVRLLYMTHPIVAGCTDIYTKFPLQGMHFECKDDKLTEFYSDLFFDQLDYETHLQRMNKEYWLVGETFSLGSWNDTLGVWDGDEVVNPDNVEVEDGLFQDEPRFLMQLPDSLTKVLTTQSPRWQYAKLIELYPELVNYAREDSRIPVSNVILKQLAFRADTFSNRGLPLIMRGFRTIIQEEMLNAALDSIADRLYTPLILTKLGASAQDLGTNVPWIPDQTEMDDFNAALDLALAGDFRALTYHWAVDMQPVFGRENVPDLSNDFDRITERLLMIWGLSQTMLTGASAGETYAADALNKDVVSQLMTHNQRDLKRFVRERMLIVAEAQEHYDYEVRGGKRYLLTEEIYEVDEEGNGRIVEVPKLLVPELTFDSLNLSDEETERQFIEGLSESGVPVTYKRRLQTVGIDFDETIEERQREDVALAVAEQETRKQTFLALREAGLPIQQDLIDDFQPKAIQEGQDAITGSAQMGGIPLQGQIPLDIPGLAATPDDIAAMQEQPTPDVNGPAAVGGQPGYDPNMLPQTGADVPPESSEERADMPKAAGLKAFASAPPIEKFGIREFTATNWAPPEQYEDELLEHSIPSGRFGDPKVYGMTYKMAKAGKIRPDVLLSHCVEDAED